VYTVEISSKGFIPEQLSIQRYDTVTFLNRDSIQHQPVLSTQSGEDSCIGFGSPRAILQNESYSFIFTKEGICGFKDSSSSFPEGAVTVNPLEQ
jgi:plastocyanin